MKIKSKDDSYSVEINAEKNTIKITMEDLPPLCQQTCVTRGECTCQNKNNIK